MIPTAEHAVIIAMLVCLGGAVASLLATILLPRQKMLAGWISFACVAVSSVLVLLGAARVLTAGPGEAVTFWTVPQIGFALRIYVDGLSAVFLGLIAVVALPAALYSVDYLAHEEASGHRRYYPCLLLFITAMYGLVSTTDMMYFFFIFWQMMTLTGWAMIRFERTKPENRRAATKYLWMMQAACSVTMIGAAMLASADVTTAGGETLMQYDFDAVLHHMPGRLESGGLVVTGAFALFLIGFGIKLGMWPFGQIWLPDAHPAAPSPVSAMLSGVMIKTGVYGLMRYFIWLIPAEAQAHYPAAGWGMVLAALGTVTLLTGTVQALKQDQSKRLLAFSSIGQAGYILLGLGICLLFLGTPGPASGAMAAAAFAGALFHTLNHGVFKSLLFLNAGSVLHATGTQDMNRLGGLMRFMPLTAVTALVASLAIAGAPLTSGFASKWAIYGPAILGKGAWVLLPICALVAIFTSAVTLALFVKFYGVMFLSRTSKLVAEKAREGGLEVTWKMRAAQAALACLCLAAGLLPGAGLLLVRQALVASPQGLGVVLAQSPAVTATPVAVVAHGGHAIYLPLVVGVVLLGLILFVRWLAAQGGSKKRAADPWLCGYAREADCHRYGSRHFYGEMQRLLRGRSARRPPPRHPAPAPDSKSN